MIVGFIALAVLRFFSLVCVLLDNNVNCEEREMKKTKATKVKQTSKLVGLFISSIIETVWAIGVAIISSGKLVA